MYIYIIYIYTHILMYIFRLRFLQLEINFDHLKTITQKGKMETRQMNLFL